MSRTTLALGLAALAAIAWLLAFAPDPPGPPLSTALVQDTTAAERERTTEPPATRSAEPTTDELPGASPEESPPNTRPSAPLPTRRSVMIDEETLRVRMKEQAMRDVRTSYTLLLEDLALPPREQEELVALLVEMSMEGMHTAYQAGRTIGSAERLERISAVIGDEKLHEFLSLEENVGAYWETGQIARLLRRHGAPLSENQRDGVFDILVEVNQRYRTAAPADVDRNSLEYLEYTMRQIDEIDRHVVELAPSVLSSTQVVHLHDAYQAMAYGRVTDLERQKKWRAERRDAPVGWYFPARWQDLVIR